MVIIENVSKVYNKKFKAVDNLNLEIKDGEIFGILGPNGSGKTTTLKMMTGSLSITEGKIKINGYDISQDSVDAKMEFGFVPDSPDIFLKLTGIEYLHFLATVYKLDKAYAKDRIELLADKFGMKENLLSKIETYSHGMRQKMVIMGALIHNPKVWILDEPLTGLDPNSIFEVKECMKEHAAAGNIVFFSSHIIDVVEKICDRIAIIKKGTLLEDVMVKDLDEKGISLESFYLETINSKKESVKK